MSTDPRNLKIVIRINGASPAAVAENQSVFAATSRIALFRIAGGIALALLISGGLWLWLAQRASDAPPPEMSETAPAVDTQLVPVTPVADPVSIAKTPPAPAPQKSVASQQPQGRVKEAGTPSGASNLVVRALLTDTMRKHLPVTELSGDVPASDVTKQFHFFTEVHDVGSQRFFHRWEYRGKAVAQISFKPSGKSWRAASSKQIPTHMQGEWRVVLVDDHANDLTSVDFVYGTNTPASN